MFTPVPKDPYSTPRVEEIQILGFADENAIWGLRGKIIGAISGSAFRPKEATALPTCSNTIRIAERSSTAEMSSAAEMGVASLANKP